MVPPDDAPPPADDAPQAPLPPDDGNTANGDTADGNPTNGHASNGNGPQRDETWINMRLSRVIVRDQSEQQWIYLSEVEGERGFPIVIGSPEAREIQRVVTGTSLERPLTHQMAYDTIRALDADLTRVDITDLRQNTFYARLVLTGRQGEVHEIDARPSDAVCLGLRAGCGIRVAESVLEQVRTDASGPDPLPSAAAEVPFEEDPSEAEHLGDDGPSDGPVAGGPIVGGPDDDTP